MVKIDDLSTALIPCDVGNICHTVGEWRALTASGNGNCLYNSISILLDGKKNDKSAQYFHVNCSM